MAEEEKTTKKEETKTETSKSKVTTPEEKKDKEKVDTKKEEKKNEKKEGTKTPEQTSEGAKEVTSTKTKEETNKTTTKETTLQREYVVPLRRGSSKVPAYKRAKKAIKTLKEFIAKHMKTENRDLKKVKIDLYLNNEIWHRGIKKPLHKIKIKATKNNDGTVNVTLAEPPQHVKFTKARTDKKILKASMAKIKGTQTKTTEKEESHKDDSKEPKKDTEEKEKASQKAGKERQKQEAKKQKHTSTGVHQKKTAPQRKSLKK